MYSSFNCRCQSTSTNANDKSAFLLVRRGYPSTLVAEKPLGVCSVYEGNKVVVTCPVRFRQDWIIAEDAAAFFFPTHYSWTSLTEV
jgi:hypothetical protein